MPTKSRIEDSKSDKTQLQSSDELRQSQDLSLDERKPPADVAGYSIHRLLGSGAYGEVWLGVDRTTGRQVAIKFYTRKNSLDFTMLSREVEKLVYLAANRYVVQLLDVGWNEDPPYYVMDYIEHGSLEDELRSRSSIPVDEAVELFEELAIGLMHLHGKGILHCDLKPGNVLLDPERKPRLADFGQSRLSHEQAPALGTLFFMAPEQADLAAAPDARWDVYALGAMMYCMLTGSPPYRNDQMAQELESSDSLETRLDTYRKLIRSAPKLTEHRKVPGVDRALADIVSRCIAADPKQRFATVQSVIDALRQRKEGIVRRPLMLLGILGPFLVLALMSGFASWAYNDSISKAERDFTQRAIESNQWAAKFAARAVAGTIEDYFSLLEAKTNDEDFRQRFEEYLNDDEVKELTPLFNDPNQNDSIDVELVNAREAYVANEKRLRLNMLVDQWLFDPKAPKAASWFVCDENGVQVAAIWDKESSPTIGKNWSYRSYFHQDPSDSVTIADDGRTVYHAFGLAGKTGHIDGEKVSEVFLSRATNTWKVAFSVPIYIDADFAGIVAVTVELGDFISFEDGANQYAMLVNGLPGTNHGIILEHPLIREAQKNLKEDQRLPDRLTTRRVDFNQLEVNQGKFVDPLGYDPNQLGAKQRWIAGSVPVQRAVNGSGAMVDTGLYVVAVQDADTVVEPARGLGRRMVQVGVLALMTFFAVTLGLSYVVFRSFGLSRRSISRFYGSGVDSTSMRDARTLLSGSDGSENGNELR